MSSKGFTLIELLVVVAIIAILAAIAIPQFAKYRKTAAEATVMSDAKNIATVLESFYADHESYPASISDGDVVHIGNETFSLSKNDEIRNYSLIGNTAYRFTVSNTHYDNMLVIYRSAK